MIRQIHLTDCDSTQDVLKEQLHSSSGGDTLLVSCENQTSGRGRGENTWKSMPGTLCFSMNLGPHQILSYTAIEIAVIISEFFLTKGKLLQLKWPNDLWNEKLLKCGGILVQGTQNNLLAGIGLNLFSHDPAFGGIFQEPFVVNKKEYALELASYIQDHRINETSVLRARWLLRCGHLNQMVRVTEGSDVIEGIFQGLGDFGEALIGTDNKVQKIYNGSLRVS
jgi:BirA family transcriptional regulator, biotin operon repressor / biotin---[acetyl-CoA-carboxylase] ligase